MLRDDRRQADQHADVAALPARKLYEEVFPDVVGALTDPPVPYHRGSPYGGKGWDTADPTVGDVHQVCCGLCGSGWRKTDGR